MWLQSKFLHNSKFHFLPVMATKYYFINFHFTPRLASTVNCGACRSFLWAYRPTFPLGEILQAFSLFLFQFQIMIMKIYQVHRIELIMLLISRHIITIILSCSSSYIILVYFIFLSFPSWSPVSFPSLCLVYLLYTFPKCLSINFFICLSTINM